MLHKKWFELEHRISFSTWNWKHFLWNLITWFQTSNNSNNLSPTKSIKFLKVLNENMQKIFQSLTKFTFFLTLTLICFSVRRIFLQKKTYTSVPSDVKKYNKCCIFCSFQELIKFAPNAIRTSSKTMNHIFAS